MIGVPVAIIATGFEDMIEEQAGANKDDQQLYEALRVYDKLTDKGKKRFRRMVEADCEEERIEE